MVVKRTTSTAKKVGSAVRKAVGRRTEPDGQPAAGTGTTKKAASGSAAKKTGTAGAATKKSSTATSSTTKAAAEKSATTKTAAKTSATTKTAAKKSATTKAAAKKAPAAKAAAKKSSSATKAPAKTTPAKKAPATRSSTSKASGPKAPAKKGAAKAAPKRKVSPASLPVRDGESPWTAAEVREVREELERDVEQLSSELQHAEDDLVDLMRDSGDGAGDDEADAGAKTYEREQEISLANNAREMLEQTQHALERLENGTYGTCESCGNPIGKMRLQAAPRATLCMPCKTKQERR